MEKVGQPETLHEPEKKMRGWLKRFSTHEPAFERTRAKDT